MMSDYRNLTHEQKLERAREKLRDLALGPWDLIPFVFLHDLEVATRGFPGTDMDVRDGNHTAVVNAMKRQALESDNPVWKSMVENL